MKPQKLALSSLIALTWFILLGSTPAQATPARLLVLGTGDAGVALNGGSFIVDDAYNIFYNPAYVNEFKNWAIIEKSNFPQATAQGGFVSSFMNFNFGVFLNRGDSVATYPNIASIGVPYPSLGQSQSTYSVAPIRPIEFFLGSDMGVRWGVGLTWASNFSGAGSSTFVTGHLGVIAGDFEPFASFKLVGADPSGSHYFYRAGLRYRLGEWTPYASFTMTGDNPNVGNSLRENTWGVGISRNKKIADGVTLIYALSFWAPSDTGGANDSVRYILPIDLAVEGEVLSWLSLMGGVNYHLVDRSQVGTNASTSNGDTTTGRIGAAIHVGKAEFAWAVGHSAPGATLETASSADAQIFDFSGGFFTAASLTYRW